MMPRILCLIVAFLAPAALATPQYFLDSSAVSPSGRFLIEAKSPHNAGETPFPFASNFTYTLTDTTTGEVVWQRSQPMTRRKGDARAFAAEPSPIQVFVNDHGLVAARTARDTLIVLNAADGSRRGEVEILRAFPVDQQHRFVSPTTAGPRWAQFSKWYFLEGPALAQNKTTDYFIVRPYWNHRLIVNLTNVTHVDVGAFASAASIEDFDGADPDLTRLLLAVIDAESHRAEEVLRNALERLENDSDFQGFRDISAALHSVAMLRLTDLEPHLRALESGLDAADRTHVRLLGKAREALRAIGQTPAPGVGLRFSRPVAEGALLIADADPYRAAVVPIEERVANARTVAPGMAVEELAELLGGPDARLFDEGHCYDYDIDDPEPYTLRVWLDHQRGNVERIKTISPFAFLHDPARMRAD